MSWSMSWSLSWSLSGSSDSSGIDILSAASSSGESKMLRISLVKCEILSILSTRKSVRVCVSVSISVAVTRLDAASASSDMAV